MIKVILGIVFGDGLIKRYLDRSEQKVVWEKGICSIRPCRNKGAVYSLGSEKPELVKSLSIGVLVIVILRWIKQCFRGGKCGKNMAYSMLIGGSISNVLDRYKKGYVVDYIHIKAKGIEKIIFNVSDVCIVLGGFLLAIAELFEKEKNE